MSRSQSEDRVSGLGSTAAGRVRAAWVRYRRIFLLAAGSGEGPLTNPQRLFAVGSGTGTVISTGVWLATIDRLVI